MARRRSRARGRAPQPRRTTSDPRPTWEVDIILLARLLDDPPDELLRHFLLVAAERGSGLVTGAELATTEGTAATLTAMLDRAMEAPLAGPPRRPGRIVVRRPELELALRLELQGRGIAVERVGHLHVVDDVADGLARHLAGAGPTERLYEGAEPALLRRFFDSAAAFWTAAPGRHLSDDDAVRVDLTDRTWHALILGAHGVERGLVLGESPADLERLRRDGATDPPLNGRLITLTYAPVADMSDADRELRRSLRLRIAGPASWPLLLCIDADGAPAPPDDEKLSAATAILRALAGFAGSRRPEPGAVTRRVEDGVGTALDIGLVYPDPDLTRPADAVDDDVSRTLARLDRLVRLLRRETEPSYANRLAWSLFGAGEPMHLENTDEERHFALARLIEWGLFIAPAGPGGRTILQQAIDRRGHSDPDFDAQRAIGLPRYALLRITSVESDGSMRAHEEWTGEEMRIANAEGGEPAPVGSLLIGTIFPVGDGQWIQGGAMILAPGDARAHCPDPRPPETPAAMAPRVEADLLGGGPEWIESLDLEDLQRAYDDFREDLADAGARLPTFRTLRNTIRDAHSPIDVLRVPQVTWWTMQEVEVFAAFVMRTWNLTSAARSSRAPRRAAAPVVDPRQARDVRAAALQLIDDAHHDLLTDPVRRLAARYIRAAAKAAPDRLARVRPESWAAAALHAASLAVGQPRLTMAMITPLFGISTATVSARSMDLRHLAADRRTPIERMKDRLEHQQQSRPRLP